MNIGIICTGDEITEGLVQEQNLYYIAKELAPLGYRVIEAVVIRDEIELIVKAVERLRESCRLVVITGGLGPTFDDVTLEALSIVTGIPLEDDVSYLEELTKRFSSRYGREIPEQLRHQARTLRGSIPIENPSGSARGLFFTNEHHADYLVMPGPPHELREVLANALQVIRKPEHILVRRTIGFVEVTEAEISPILESLRRRFPHVRMITRADYAIGPTVFLIAREEHSKDIQRVAKELSERFRGFAFTTRGEDFLGLLVDRLRGRGLTLSTAESCTGGMLSSALVSVPGVSDTFLGGVTTYSNTSKLSVLGISKDLIDKHGAVSKECAAVMAENVSGVFSADVGLAITGIAGPTGATSNKPLGLVYSAIHSRIRQEIYESVYTGTRHNIMTKASYGLLKKLWRMLFRQ